jgi:hypothetical protein
MRASIEPGKSASEHFDMEVSAFQVRIVDISDLDLAGCRMLHFGGDIQQLVVEEVKGRSSRRWFSAASALPRSSALCRSL